MSIVSEAELIERSVGPRVSFDEVQANIKETTFYQHGLLTICIIELQNGFTVTGQSACADPKNFMLDVGQRLAKNDAINKIWPLMGYELKNKVMLVDEASGPSRSGMLTYVGTKVIHAHEINRRDYNQFRGWKLPTDENGDDEGYLVEYPDQPSNTVDYKGYVSWSPKDVFEAAYSVLGSAKKALTFIDRMRIEHKELEDKLYRLNQFIETDDYNKLSSDDRHDLIFQAEAMTAYQAILFRRLQRAEAQENKE